jgi:uncharacterized lipoprotein YmbA
MLFAIGYLTTSEIAMPRLAVLVLMPLSLIGCAGTSPPTHFYALEAGSAVAPAVSHPDLAIGLGPVTLPDSLDRPQILVRPEPYRRELSEFDRWAGDLKGNLTRVLGVRLGGLLGSRRVFLYPWPHYRHLDRQVQVDLLTLEGRPGGQAELRGSWTLLDGDGQQELHLDAFDWHQPVAGNDYRALVAAMSTLVDRLAGRIAEVIVTRLPR